MDRLFTAIANRVSAFVGQPIAFMIALTIVIVWGVTGPVFQYSDTWQLVINTGTMTYDQVVAMIVSAYRAKYPTPTEASPTVNKH